MSLYEIEEVCVGCIYSHWHESCENCYDGMGRFCHCEEKNEHSIDFIGGKCRYFKLKGKDEC